MYADGHLVLPDAYALPLPLGGVWVTLRLPGVGACVVDAALVLWCWRGPRRRQSPRPLAHVSGGPVVHAVADVCWFDVQPLPPLWPEFTWCACNMLSRLWTLSCPMIIGRVAWRLWWVGGCLQLDLVGCGGWDPRVCLCGRLCLWNKVLCSWYHPYSSFPVSCIVSLASIVHVV